MARHRLKLGILFLCVLGCVSRARAWPAEIVSADEILPPRAFGGPVQASCEFESQAGVRLVLDLDPTLLDISNPHAGDRFYPVEASQVRFALEAMREFAHGQVAARIYCLPGLPRATAKSFAVGTEIFLAPGLGELSQNIVAYTVTHELGHVVQHAFMPGRHGRVWMDYLQTRGLDARSHNDDSAHRDRPGEIFAEDFRALFGGPDATQSHTLENPTLAWPTEVPGLESYFMSLPQQSERGGPRASAHNFPNPFNPVTTITTELSDEMLIPGETVWITIFDLRGRKLRELRPLPVTPTIAVEFHGRDDRGARLASGRYLYEIRVGSHRVTGAMTLVQ
jgi:hypothetical protein